jgi:K(+)-stimulated pyrophosphate-energized sodium pump
MMLPGAIAIISPLVIGFLLGPEVLGGFLAGATVSGVLMGMFQNNAGGAWDNAKKSFEKGVDINGETYFKKSEPHKASVTGDTVGDPFKDTSGPSMNILIKLMSIVSLVIAPTLSGMFHENIQHHRQAKIKTMMEACVKAGCTEAECANVMGAGKSCCSEDAATCSGESEECKATCGGKCDKATCDKPCCKGAEAATETTQLKGALNADGDFVYEPGATNILVLGDGSKIKATENSSEKKVLNFINDNTKVVDKATWFTMDHLFFETGSAKLKPSSEEQVKNIATILKAYPNVNIKLGGYTDNTGDSIANVKLSHERAEAAKAAIVKNGITAKRIEAEGYGPQFPICGANDTKECKAQNRRIDVRITKK